ncbi:UNVERIFIED_ORG: hypothetical protein BTE55_25635 [Rhizobium sophorae]
MLAGQLSFVNDWRKPSCKQRREPETTTVHLLSFAAGVITPANASRLSELRVARTMRAKDLDVEPQQVVLGQAESADWCIIF